MIQGNKEQSSQQSGKRVKHLGWCPEKEMPRHVSIRRVNHLPG
jgi:hypothetical protein